MPCDGTQKTGQIAAAEIRLQLLPSAMLTLPQIYGLYNKGQRLQFYSLDNSRISLLEDPVQIKILYKYI